MLHCFHMDKQKWVSNLYLKHSQGIQRSGDYTHYLKSQQHFIHIRNRTISMEISPSFLLLFTRVFPTLTCQQFLSEKGTTWSNEQSFFPPPTSASLPLDSPQQQEVWRFRLQVLTRLEINVHVWIFMVRYQNMQVGRRWLFPCWQWGRSWL